MATFTTQRPKTEDIAREAYFLYQQRGGQPGHELEDWLKAEALLSAAHASNGSTPDPGHQITWQQSGKPAETRTTRRSKSF